MLNDVENYTPKKAAEVLGIGQSTLYRMMKEGEIRFTRIGPGDRLIRISGKELARLLGNTGDER